MQFLSCALTWFYSRSPGDLFWITRSKRNISSTRSHPPPNPLPWVAVDSGGGLPAPFGKSSNNHRGTTTLFRWPWKAIATGCLFLFLVMYLAWSSVFAAITAKCRLHPGTYSYGSCEFSNRGWGTKGVCIFAGLRNAKGKTCHDKVCSGVLLPGEASRRRIQVGELPKSFCRESCRLHMKSAK